MPKICLLNSEFGVIHNIFTGTTSWNKFAEFLGRIYWKMLDSRNTSRRYKIKSHEYAAEYFKIVKENVNITFSGKFCKEIYFAAVDEKHFCVLKWLFYTNFIIFFLRIYQILYLPFYRKNRTLVIISKSV